MKDDEVRRPAPAVLHRARWLLTGRGFPVEDGAVLVEGETIRAAGTFKDVRAFLPARGGVRDHGDAALVAGLVNAHTHLDWSVLRGDLVFPLEGFRAWLEEILAVRGTFSPEEHRRAAEASVAEMHGTGTAVFADMTNDPALSWRCGRRGCGVPHRRLFVEVLGFDRWRLEDVPVLDALGIGDEEGPGMEPISLAAHSPYAVSPELIVSAKAWCRRLGRPFSIHVAEHPEEVEFVRNGTGFCREVLQRLGRWVETWRPPGATPVAYLDQLGVLDERTLLVHAVHVTAEDTERIRRRGAAVCFCPRSNHHMGVGRPNIARFIEAGVPTALGTDSLASNTDLNLFREAAFVLDHWPEMDPAVVLQMATVGGAGVLGVQASRGSLESGKRAEFTAIPLPPAISPREVVEAVIREGQEGRCQWIVGSAEGCGSEGSAS